jgi:hypothetical protein
MLWLTVSLEVWSWATICNFLTIKISRITPLFSNCGLKIAKLTVKKL